MRNLRLVNDFLVYVLPWMVNAFCVLVIRSCMDRLPFELQESAKVDGAGDFPIFLRIVLPLCRPVKDIPMAILGKPADFDATYDTMLAELARVTGTMQDAESALVKDWITLWGTK